MSRHIQIVIALLLLGLVLRLGWSFSRPATDAAMAELKLPDQVEYLQAGRNLLEGKGFWFDDPRFGQRVYASRTIGYPLLVAMCRGKIRTIQIVQCFLDVSTALAAYLIARRWLGYGRSLVAMGLVIFNPLLIYFCPLILSETLYVAMLTWCVYLVTIPAMLVWGVVIAAVSVHVRPSGVPMAAVIGALGALMNALPGKRNSAAAIYAVVGMAATVVVLSPWAMRNENVLGRRVWLSSNGGITLYDGFRPGATGASEQSFVSAMPELRKMNELQRDAYFRKLSASAIADDPRRAVRLAFIKAGRTWSPIPLSKQFSSGLYMAVGLLYTVPLFIFAAVGIFWSRLPTRARLLLIAPALVITAMHAISVGSMRYRLPAEPMLCVLAAGALSRKPEVK